MLSLEFFYRFLFSRRAGSLVKTIARISVVGIWLGVSALIIVVSVMNGFNKTIRERLLEVEPHLVVRFKNIKSSTEIKNHPVWSKLEKIGVEFMAPSSQQDIIMRTSEGYIQGAIAQGVTRERLKGLLEFAALRNKSSIDGIDEKVNNLKASDILMGVGLADAMGLFNDDTVVLIPPESLLMPSGEIPTLSQATVKGFLMTDVERLDTRSFFYILDESLQRFNSTAGYDLNLEAWLTDPAKSDQIKKQLLNDDIEIETWTERNASLFFALKMEKIVVSVLVGLSTLIAGLSIISVMVLLVTQKRRDVGNLLAIGMTKKQVKNIFVQIGVFLAMGGLFAGLITGVMSCLLIDRFSQDLLPSFYEETNIPAEIQWMQVASIIIIGFILTYTVLTWTMSKISSYQPSEILRS